MSPSLETVLKSLAGMDEAGPLGGGSISAEGVLNLDALRLLLFLSHEPFTLLWKSEEKIENR